MVQLEFCDLAGRQLSRLSVALQNTSNLSLHTIHLHPEMHLSPSLIIIHPHREPIYGLHHTEDE